MNAITSQEKAYSFLKTAILDLEYKPDERLTAQDIADHLRLSRTPVREALSRLEQEGLVFHSSGWGYVVRGLSVKEVIDLYKVREVLEIAAVREAVPKLTCGVIDKMQTLLDRAEQSIVKGKQGDFRNNTRAFYREVAKVSENAYLELMLSLIDDRIRWLGAVIAVRYSERPIESLKDNKELLRALAKRDGQAAVRATKKHIAGARARFLNYVMADKGKLRI